MNEGEFMTVEQMAEAMHISLPAAYQLTETKGFPVFHVGRRKLILHAKLIEWAANGGGATNDRN